jgi:hypothetical protein
VDDDGLTDQQRLFVAEYLKDNNATQAAIRAGYSKKTANEQGARLLAKVSIAQAIAQQQKASIVRTLGSADEVLEQMWRLATFDANFLSIAAGAAVTAGASVTSINGAMRLSTKRSWLRL